MSPKKILVVSSSFYPMNSPRSFRTTELAKEFARQGHLVTVITPKSKNLHKKFEQQHNLIIKDLGKPKFKPISLKGDGMKLLIRRLLRRLGVLLIQYPNIELMFLVRKALVQETGYDLLISIAAPHTVQWGVAWAWREKKTIANTWVADCGDPFMGLENDTFTPPFYFGILERFFCKKADFITVPTKGAIQGYYPEFQHKTRVIPQGFRFEDIRVNGTVNNSIPTFAYAGGFIPGRRDPREFIEYIIGLEQDFKFYIYTNSPALVEQYLEKSQGRIILQKNIPRVDLLNQLGRMDFVVNFENIGKRQTPSKLIDYGIICKPILSIKTGHLNKKIIEEFLSGDYKNGLKIDNLDQYRVENVCKRFLQLINK